MSIQLNPTKKGPREKGRKRKRPMQKGRLLSGFQNRRKEKKKKEIVAVCVPDALVLKHSLNRGQIKTKTRPINEELR